MSGFTPEEIRSIAKAGARSVYRVIKAEGSPVLSVTVAVTLDDGKDIAAKHSRDTTPDEVRQ